MSNDSPSASVKSGKFSDSSNSSGLINHDPMNITDYMDTITAKNNALKPTLDNPLKRS